MQALEHGLHKQWAAIKVSRGVQSKSHSATVCHTERPRREQKPEGISSSSQSITRSRVTCRFNRERAVVAAGRLQSRLVPSQSEGFDPVSRTVLGRRHLGQGRARVCGVGEDCLRFHRRRWRQSGPAERYSRIPHNRRRKRHSARQFNWRVPEQLAP